MKATLKAVFAVDRFYDGNQQIAEIIQVLWSSS